SVARGHFMLAVDTGIEHRHRCFAWDGIKPVRAAIDAWVRNQSAVTRSANENRPFRIRAVQIGKSCHMHIAAIPRLQETRADRDAIAHMRARCWVVNGGVEL